MAIIRSVVEHFGPGGNFESICVFDDSVAAPRPGVLVFPNVLGIKEADIVRGERLAALGYMALVIDIYGVGKRTTRESPDPAIHMNALLAQPVTMRERLLSAAELLKMQPCVDQERTGAIGFCFGGRCVLDLARAGGDIKGGVSFHGIYKRPPWNNAAIAAKLLILHGWNDPHCPVEDTLALCTELSEAGADWQLHAYGGTYHAFTDNGTNIPERGLIYSEMADRRSWTAMTDFFAEIFA